MRTLTGLNWHWIVSFVNMIVDDHLNSWKLTGGRSFKMELIVQNIILIPSSRPKSLA
jgi:hypothetical protein